MTSPTPNPPPPGIPPEPSPAERREEGPRYGAMIVGLVILAVGVWFFADRTLGLDLPRLEADQLWPIAIIALGAWLIVRPNR